MTTEEKIYAMQILTETGMENITSGKSIDAVIGIYRECKRLGYEARVVEICGDKMKVVRE